MPRLLAVALAALVALAPSARASGPGLSFFSVGGGELGLGYDTVVRAICAQVNAAHPGRLRCSAEATPGARYNLDALLSGELGFGIVQADLLHAATHGDQGHPLRLVARLYDETFVVLAGADTPITRLADLEGQRVDIGRPASGRHVSARTIFAATGVDVAAFAGVFTLTADTAIAELCDGRLEAVALVVGQPSALVARAVDRCGARVVALTAAEQQAVIARSPAFHRGQVAASHLSALSRDVPTVALAAALLARADEPYGLVAALAAVLQDRRAALAAATPLLAAFDPMLPVEGDEGLPMHPGVRAALSP